jgi:hypothetical protein
MSQSAAKYWIVLVKLVSTHTHVTCIGGSESPSSDIEIIIINKLKENPVLENTL